MFDSAHRRLSLDLPHATFLLPVRVLLTVAHFSLARCKECRPLQGLFDIASQILNLAMDYLHCFHKNPIMDLTLLGARCNPLNDQNSTNFLASWCFGIARNIAKDTVVSGDRRGWYHDTNAA